MTRRDNLLALAALPAGIGQPAAANPGTKWNVVCLGGHPDDPETGCGATLARYSARGHNVSIIYLTRGEAGIQGKSHAEAAHIRTEEATQACHILSAQPIFAGQIDGASEVTNARYQDLDGILRAQRPDILFTHWPVDTHRDHCAASLLAYQSWYRGGKKYPLVYFEVMSGEQTQEFHPNFYVDVTETWEKKKQACFAHASQGPAEFYPYHEEMERFRGLEHRCQRAEAFIVHTQGPLPLLAW
jgi:N-acetylglucosamine malate deacetylase 1